MNFTENSQRKTQSLVNNAGKKPITKSQKISERHRLNITVLFYWITAITLKSFGKFLGKYLKKAGVEQKLTKSK